MQVQVLYFGVLREMFGVASETLVLSNGACTRDVVQMLRQRSGVHAAPWSALAIAVNREYAPGSAMLHDGDEVALLPPVSGGTRED